MFKTLATIFRGRTAEAAERLADANALTILDQQIRDSAGVLDRARRALAIALAQNATETRRVDGVKARIADLESRAMAALDGGREDMATEAAEAIAGLEADFDSATASQAGFARQSAKLKGIIGDAERRMAELERGRRAARASDAVQRLRVNGQAQLGAGPLIEAEATLRRVQNLQAESQAAGEALDALDGTSGSERISQRLEAAGFGQTVKPTAKNVLERLKQQKYIVTTSI